MAEQILKNCCEINICFLIRICYRRWKGGCIEPHPTDKALIVNYQLEATVFGEPNNPMIEEKKVLITTFS